MTATSARIRTYVVGLTGGIGSGKTTVSDLFAARYKVPVVDADIVSREVVAPGEPALAELVQQFGADITGADGQLDRAALKRIVFADADKRKTLEAILHPAIRTRMAAQLAAVDAPYALMSIPLLAEGGRRDLINRVLVVDCPEALQLERVRRRDNLTEQEVMAIMQTQASRQQRLAIADDVIVNDGDAAALALRVAELHETYLGLAALAAGRT